MKHKLTSFALTIFLSYSAFAQLKLQDLKVDTTITGFRYAADFQGTYVFTKNGASDLNTLNPSAFSFTIAPDKTYQFAVLQLDQLLNMSKENGYKISAMTRKDTTVNGNRAFYISYIEEGPSNYKNIVYNAFLFKESTLVLFTSGDLDNGAYADRFKKTFYSIKL